MSRSRKNINLREKGSSDSSSSDYLPLTRKQLAKKESFSNSPSSISSSEYVVHSGRGGRGGKGVRVQKLSLGQKELEKFIAGIKVGKLNRGELQETKMDDISMYLPSVLSELSLDMESGFTGQLATTIPQSFTVVAELPGNRIVTSNSKKLKVWDMLTQKVLLKIKVPSTLPYAAFINEIKISDDKIIIGYYHGGFNTEKKVNGMVVFDSNTGNILAKLKETHDVIYNIFVMPNSNIFFSTGRKKSTNTLTISSYLWNIVEDTITEVGSPLVERYSIKVKIVLLPNKDFALFDNGKMFFYRMDNLHLPYLELNIKSIVGQELDVGVQIMYLSNRRIVFIERDVIFWISSVNGELVEKINLNINNSLFLAFNRAVISTYRDSILKVQIWDLLAGKPIITLPDISSQPNLRIHYFPIGLLPNGNLASVYEDQYLIITNLLTNQHEQGIDLQKRTIQMDTLIFDDGGIAIKFLDSFKVYR